MSKQYAVVGAMASAKVGTERGTQVLYFYEGAVLPDGVDKESIEHLVDVGLIAPVDAGSSAESGAPAKSANKADWVDYAVSQGMSREDADSATKDDLVEAYGS